MGTHEPPPRPLTDEEYEALAARVCELLACEPHASRLRAALASRDAEPEPDDPLPVASGDPRGPAPIGPYEISPQFQSMRWDGERPDAPEWPTPGGPGPAARPRAGVFAGPIVTRARSSDDGQAD